MRLDWSGFTGLLFQDLCLDLLSAEGFGVEERGVGPDGGVDALLREPCPLPDGSTRVLRWISQFKFKSTPSDTVGPSELGNVANLLLRFHADAFFLITNGRVTAKTAEELRATTGGLRPRAVSSIWTGRHIVGRLECNPDIARRYFPGWCPPKREAVPVEVLISTSFAEFSELHSRLLVHALAEFLEISPRAVTIRKVEPGSTKVVVHLPADAARLLIEAFEGGYLDLQAGGFPEDVLQVSPKGTGPEEGVGQDSYAVLESVETTPIAVYLNSYAQELFILFRKAAHRNLRAFSISDQYDAEDLALDTLMHLTERTWTGDDLKDMTPGKFYSIALAAQRRILLDRSRRASAMKRGATFARALVDIDSIEIKEETVLENTLLIDLEDALGKLGDVLPAAAAAIQLRYFGGFTVKETAKVLGVGRGTVVKRTVSGLRRLRTLLGDKARGDTENR